MPREVFKFDVTGAEEVAAGFNRFSNMLDKELTVELSRIIKKFKNDLVRSMENTPKDTEPWRKYIGRDGKYHSPSRPGSPPGIASGNLVKSIRTTVRAKRKEAELYFTDKGFYIEYLEDGTSKMFRRPSVEPAFERLEVEEGLNAVLTKVVHAY